MKYTWDFIKENIVVYEDGVEILSFNRMVDAFEVTCRLGIRLASDNLVAS